MLSVAEEWRAIPGFEGMYEISERGNARSLDRTITTRRGYRFRLRGVNLRAKYDKHGYVYYMPSCENKASCLFAHTLVAAVFVGDRPNGMHINHIDGNKTNNHFSNLEYVTPKENTRHAMKNGLLKCVGEDNSQAIATADQIRAGYELLLQGVGVTKAAKSVGLSPITLQSVKGGWMWKSLNLPRLVGQKISQGDRA